MNLYTHCTALNCIFIYIVDLDVTLPDLLYVAEQLF